MSLVPTYVQGTDGNYYRNPVLFNGDVEKITDWFICFDDELCRIEHHGKVSPSKLESITSGVVYKFD